MSADSPSPKRRASAGPAPAPTRRQVQRRPLHQGAFAGWVVVGILWALSIASAMSIGVFLMPVALILTLVMCLGYVRPHGWPGAIGGIGLVALYVGFLHRHGPGRYCTVPGDAKTCTDLLDPWPFAAVGVALLVACALVSWRWYTRPVQPRHSRR